MTFCASSAAQWWLDESAWLQPLVIRDGSRHLCAFDFRVNECCFKAKVVHFGDPCHFRASWSTAEGHALEIAGPSAAATERSIQDNFIVHRSQLETFQRLECGKWKSEVNLAFVRQE